MSSRFYSPQRFIFYYTLGSIKRCWECEEVTYAMARARFWAAKGIKGVSGVRLRGVYTARESFGDTEVSNG